MRVCIIGGGASGLYCAMHIKLLNPALDVTILEKHPRVGKKLLATGNGKCNFTNTNQNRSRYTSETPEMAGKILDMHPTDAILDTFESIGIPATIKDTLVYPRSMQAASVLDMLRYKNEALGVHTLTDFEVKTIKKQGNVFKINGETEADVLVIASGSSASGGSASGLKLLRSFGHSVSPVYPALVPVVCDTTNTKLAKGMRAHCKVALYKNNTEIANQVGEILFTEYGVSGICILQLSRHIAQSRALGEKAIFFFRIDFAPKTDADALQAQLAKRRDTLGYLPIGEFLGGFINKKIGQAVLKQCGISNFNVLSENLSDKNIQVCTETIKQFDIRISDTLDASHAQVCGGGIRLSEFTENLESLNHENLYACGEVLDIVGDCGGYNLTWAWASAYAAAYKIGKCK